MPGKHLLIETESADGDGEGSEPDSKGTVPSTESRVRLAFTFFIETIISGRFEDDKPCVQAFSS